EPGILSCGSVEVHGGGPSGRLMKYQQKRENPGVVATTTEPRLSGSGTDSLPDYLGLLWFLAAAPAGAIPRTQNQFGPRLPIPDSGKNAHGATVLSSGRDPRVSGPYRATLWPFW